MRPEPIQLPEELLELTYRPDYYVMRELMYHQAQGFSKSHG